MPVPAPNLYPPFHIVRLSHVVLGVTDLAASRAFYADTLGLQVTDVPALGTHLEACVEALVAYIRTLSDADLDEVVDESYTPAVTRGARLVSIVDDAVAHVGQAAYARGLVSGWSLGV